MKARFMMSLPGPAEFLRAVSEDLLGGNCVMVALPAGLSGDLFRACVTRAVRANSSGTGDRLENALPASVVSELVGSRASTRRLVYLDALSSGESVAKDWDWYVGPHGRARMLDYIQTRVCVVIRESAVIRRRVEKHFRQRFWCDYVSNLDSMTVAFEHMRQLNYSDEYKALKVSLVGSLCGPDLLAAEQYSEYSLRQLVNVDEHSRESIWSGQVSALFPLVNRERIRLLRRYPRFWRLNGNESLLDLEIDKMNEQAGDRKSLDPRDRKQIRWLLRVRNALAHMDCIPWADLVRSPIFEFSQRHDADVVR